MRAHEHPTSHKASSYFIWQNPPSTRTQLHQQLSEKLGIFGTFQSFNQHKATHVIHFLLPQKQRTEPTH